MQRLLSKNIFILLWVRDENSKWKMFTQGNFVSTFTPIFLANFFKPKQIFKFNVYNLSKSGLKLVIV